eukprot:CAMPEP_0194109274 /NCGR_PEP_ID=MMETSP0150-20130528/8795_1 /TAXON_ID=122233 /ORGANISM="Chaetoceros debilis, Strain MM31A-1" /LENGTH=542 /DNA_ID=CAMNT_0038798199 /DNA_START=197 /DNA_END=1826 /DNA_ORIENTATION=+
MIPGFGDDFIFEDGVPSYSFHSRNSRLTSGNEDPKDINSRISRKAGETMDQSAVFTDLSHRIQSLQQSCHKRDGNVADNNNSPSSLSSLSSLPKDNEDSLKILQDLRKVIGTQGKVPTRPSSTIASSSCISPPTESCSASQYSVIISYEISQQSPQTIRTLFINMLSLLSHERTKANIAVVLHGTNDAIDKLIKDHNYGRRIKNWSENNVIRLILQRQERSGIGHDEGNENDNEDDLFYLVRPSMLDYLEHDILLFLDGSVPLVNLNDGSGGMESLDAGFELIRKDSRCLVGNRVLEWSNGNGPGEENDAMSPDSERLFQPICDRQDRSNPKSGANRVESIHMSGMFIHRNYLCFLWHDVFAPLRNIVGGLNQKYNRNHKVKGDISSLTITTLVTQLSGKIPALYPMVQQTWKTKESLHSNVSSRRLTDTSDLEVGHNMFDNMSIERRRRFSWDLNDRFEKKEEEGRRKLLQAKVPVGEHFRRTIDLTCEDANSILIILEAFQGVNLVGVKDLFGNKNKIMGAMINVCGNLIEKLQHRVPYG